MATLPAPIDRKSFEAPRRDFEAMEKELKLIAGVPTLMQMTRAKECDDIAKAFLDKKNPDSPEAKIGPHRDKAYSTWKGLVAWLADEEKTPKSVRSLYSALAGRYERERQRKIAEQKRLDEQRQREQAERNRKAEADHLMEIAAATNDPAALEAAIEVENTPITTPISTVDPDAGKVPGSSVTIRKIGKIVDIRAFSAWLSTYASAADLIQVKNDPADTGPAFWITQSALDDKLNRGIEIPGVLVLERAITRNTSRG